MTDQSHFTPAADLEDVYNSERVAEWTTINPPRSPEENAFDSMVMYLYSRLDEQTERTDTLDQLAEVLGFEVGTLTETLAEKEDLVAAYHDEVDRLDEALKGAIETVRSQTVQLDDMRIKLKDQQSKNKFRWW